MVNILWSGLLVSIWGEWIKDEKGGYLTIGGREKGKKVDKQPLKIKKIQAGVFGKNGGP